ncbi:MAG TPA: helix-turn-helix transcriptional regulator [Ramlibacter sp.]|nr:helix-turn-helix transcriptional regulator [Ramlibacter sp.]
MSTKKPATAQTDMHPADVIAALRKHGLSLRQLAKQNGYSHIQRVLTGPWLAAEQIVAKALGVEPKEIWPSRYVNPADRRRAFELTRKIKVTMPRKAKEARPVASSGRKGQ